ncbi:MAG TPA: peptide chain release factor N(5)-glutamine methyltransferase [Ferruginibacter sp.]|nr:peptide chain release factor N(5)-glutamine methyltransferase [Ferruginibacter sp.]
MTLKEVYRKILEQAQSIYSLSEATTMTDWIFENVADVQRADIIKTPDLEISQSILAELDNRLHQLLLHKPIQYILGEAWFYDMKLKVDEHVLIPRPETEELVSMIITNHEENVPKILDIGTGSGCIPIALKKHLPAAIITSIDISEGAILLAKENAMIQETVIEFIHSDFLDEKSWINFPTFDVIVSNPPYIPLSEKEKMDKNVTAFEPHLALFVPDNDPLLFYRKIAQFGKKHLNVDGKIYLETHEDHAKETAALFTSLAYEQVIIKEDMFGKERMVIVQQ